MGKLNSNHSPANVNVTLPQGPSDDLAVFSGKDFPCPLCGAGLPILNSKRNKPYCTCNDCGLQLFVRGKKGIARLAHMAQEEIVISVREESVAHGISLLNRAEQLKLQKNDLEQKQGIIFTDKNVENAISLVDAEIEKVQRELAQLITSKTNGRSMMRNAVIYARVSSKEQEREGFSIPAQLKLLHEYARRNELEIVKEFVDIETAKMTGRKQFGEMKQFLSRNSSCRAVIVEKTDRLYRNFKDHITIEELDVELHLVKEARSSARILNHRRNLFTEFNSLWHEIALRICGKKSKKE